MIRKEEREQAAHNYAFYFPEDYVNENDYIAGAEWADKTMLDRVCEWLRGNLPYSSKPPYQVIEDLRKAMEE